MYVQHADNLLLLTVSEYFMCVVMIELTQLQKDIKCYCSVSCTMCIWNSFASRVLLSESNFIYCA